MTGAVVALWKREVIKFGRDYSRLIGALVQPLAVWLVLGMGFRGTFQVPYAGPEAISYIEFLFPGAVALVALFTAIFSTISIVEERRVGIIQAALVAPVPRSSIVLGTTLGGTTLAVAEAILFMALLPTIRLFPAAAGLLLMVIVTALIGITFTALGVLVAWRTRTTRGFHAIMNLFLLPLWVLSGAFFPVEGAPPFLQWAIRLNPVAYGVDAFRWSLYFPASPPVSVADPFVAFAVTVISAVLVFAGAVWLVRRPLYR